LVNCLSNAAGLKRMTAMAYEKPLVNLMVNDRAQPWRSNRLKRLVRSPKRYLTDAALLAGILRADANAILREGDLLGRLLYHLRQEQGRHGQPTPTISPGSVTSLASASSRAWCFTPGRERTSSMNVSSRRRSPRSGHTRPHPEENG
jgi:hypothetical protein